MPYITHASQITFNDVILCENEQEYNDVLSIIKNHKVEYSNLSGFELPNTEFCKIGFTSNYEVTDIQKPNFYPNINITPAQYFINANKKSV